MKKFIYLFALLGLTIAPVQATTVFDFNGYATSLGEQGFDTVTGLVVTEGNVTLTATGSDANGAAHAYLDGPFNGGEGGLGVCSTLDGVGGECDPGNDDNVTGGESLKLDFGWDVRLDKVELLDGVHLGLFDNNPGSFAVSVDGGAQQLITLATFPDVTGLLDGQVFEFFNVGGGANSEFYINNIGISTVPVPAAGILFASALFGAGALGRRKKKAKASVVGAFARAS